MKKSIVITSSILICTAIILGAMAAHALEKIVSTELIASFDKGVQYQFICGFTLLIIGLNQTKFQFNLKWFYRLNIIGLILFSGCIYLYTIHTFLPELKFFVYLVPIGGVSFILAWIILIWQLLSKQKEIN